MVAMSPVIHVIDDDESVRESLVRLLGVAGGAHYNAGFVRLARDREEVRGREVGYRLDV